MTALIATELKLRTTSRVLQVTFAGGEVFELPFEYLRVHSPSAEVKGHGPGQEVLGQEVLVTGKAAVGIRAIEPVGQYAVNWCSTTAMTPVSSPGSICSSWDATERRTGRHTRREFSPQQPGPPMEAHKKGPSY
ncbi:MAG: gamma-butyrobetaine hydroxylase-like domain-containing protein [Steroidobacteraceae bacterium]